MRRLFAFLPLCLLGLVLAACTPGPDVDVVTQEIQNKLDTQFQEGLFKVVSMKRQGGTPAGGENRVLAYFNAEIEFLKDYSLSAWEDLNLASLAYVLGATEKGIENFKPQGNKKGDVLKVYGSGTFTQADGQWRPDAPAATGRKPGAGPDVDRMGHRNTASPSGTTALLTEINTLVAGVGTKEPQVEIVEEELGNVLRAINFRIDKVENISALTTGEPGGEYFPVGQALQVSIGGKDLQLRNYASAGSVDNCALVENRVVDFALVQNDIAAMAYGGDGIFADRGSMGHLRALASLFPEPIQVVTLKSSGLGSITDLKGKKIDIGLPKSGSQVNALQILDAHGLALSDFAEVTEKGFAESIEALKSGAVDAFFVTLAAPSGQLQRLSSADPIRLLSMDPEAREKLLTLRPYYVPLTLPANTYPGQSEAVQTLSVTAMLITHQETPDAKVEELLGGLFENIDAIARESFQASVISRNTARDGISIPLHPAAEQYYAQ